MTSIKERVKKAQGKEVPLDYFLYSCLERERTIKALGKGYAQDMRWPPLAAPGAEAGIGPEIHNGSLEVLFKSLTHWYATHAPVLADSKPLDYEHLNDVVPAFVSFTHDLDSLTLLKTDQKLPASNAKEAAPVALWDALREALKKDFPGYSHLFIRYLEWSHAVEVVEYVEPGSRPPVGRFAPPMRLRQGGTGPGSRPAKSSSDGRPPRRDGDSRGPRPEFRGGDRPHREDRPARDEGDRPPRRDGEGPRRDGRPPRDGGRGRPGGDGERSSELEQAAMDEVRQAVANLRKNTELQEVRLKPVNSYYRRLQHQEAVAEGFNSTSIGGGSDRAVKVSRQGEGSSESSGD